MPQLNQQLETMTKLKLGQKLVVKEPFEAEMLEHDNEPINRTMGLGDTLVVTDVISSFFVVNDGENDWRLEHSDIQYLNTMTHIYLAQLPNFCGYGICVLAHRKDEAICLLRDKYNEWRKHNVLDSNMNTFKKAMDYFGGSVERIEIGKTYCDEFKS